MLTLTKNISIGAILAVLLFFVVIKEYKKLLLYWDLSDITCAVLKY
ncbi:MAG: hypothetical protein R2847_01395 [Bacteroidia bacterium]